DKYQNIGYMTIGTSGDTSEFACESIRRWWINYGKIEYKGHNKLLLLCDGGGSNSSRHYIFKEDLQKLANELKIEIRIAHYPPYTSKYNPIEHRLFPHVTRALQGVVFSSVELVNNLVNQTKTESGLKVFSSILNKVFETGRKYSEGFKENMKIQFDDYLANWNYVAVPQNC
ncbi:MAG TPA: ISAzo13 family transposase, partial [Campylobacterales bacterium]|nr:ISAzo13 family transposase [Campylobacterales bacterium]